MILLLDNYDSFTYNLYQMLGCFDQEIEVVRNDACTADELISLNPCGVVLSPGPGYPQSAGMMVELIRKIYKTTPLLGVCLGHQAIACAFGAEIIRAPKPVHGKTSQISTDSSCPLFCDLKQPVEVARYHSLIVDRKTLTHPLRVAAENKEGLVMALSHQVLPVFGLQFHPESILTNKGSQILQRFVEIARAKKQDPL